MMSSLTAADVLEVLERRYRVTGDLFFTQVATNRVDRGYRRVDAVAVKPSWASACITVYEVKTSVSDFRSDTKWTEYLGYCHRFYWASPKGLIKADQVAEPAGLIWVNEDRGWKVVRKALYRPVDWSTAWTIIYSM